ncbi:hypothetical protein JOC34_000536 [Virgibacillus halotolerans]|uniref:hypothetical protein n=1 Tax=Virgibacillus halotolerans TaxID=1071053 RepID=UPI001961F67B|nr:hypothetical protein [Virgibacillus halotolerans]MBM7598179.1 hypothetical protein [Virgibacillus halotolerans]
MFNEEQLHDVIAGFIIKDFREQGIAFGIDDEGFNFETREDAEKSIKRAQEMGYNKWLFNGEETIDIVDNN